MKSWEVSGMLIHCTSLHSGRKRKRILPHTVMQVHLPFGPSPLTSLSGDHLLTSAVHLSYTHAMTFDSHNPYLKSTRYVRFLQRSALLTTHHCSFSCGGDQITLCIAFPRCQQSKTNEHIGPLLLCRFLPCLLPASPTFQLLLSCHTLVKVCSIPTVKL